jgi:AbrB family looped-hinge helix DNA binding protein
MKLSTSEEVKVGKRFTVVIPKKVRKLVNLQEGQRALMYVEDGKIVIEPLLADPFKTLEEIVREPYEEEKEEKKVEEWLRERAGR